MTSNRNRHGDHARRQAAIDDRLADLEQQNARLFSEQHATRTDLEKLTVSVDRLSQQVSEWMRNSGRLNLGWVIGGVGLLATIGTLAASPFIRDQARLEANYREVEGRVDSMAADRWTRKDHEHYQDRVQGDLALVEAQLFERIEKVADELATHKANGHPFTVLDKIAVVEKELDAVRADLIERGKWMTQTTVGFAENGAAYDARLADLEREVREISSEQRRRTSRVYNEE